MGQVGTMSWPWLGKGWSRGRARGYPVLVLSREGWGRCGIGTLFWSYPGRDGAGWGTLSWSWPKGMGQSGSRVGYPILVLAKGDGAGCGRGGGTLSGQGTHPPLLLSEQTHTCENITSHRTTYAGGNNRQLIFPLTVTMEKWFGNVLVGNTDLIRSVLTPHRPILSNTGVRLRFI